MALLLRRITAAQMDTSVNLSSVVVASSLEDQSQPNSNIVEGIVIPPDPERGGSVPDSFESLCIDAEVYPFCEIFSYRDVQIDLVSVIRSMAFYLILSIIMTVSMFLYSNFRFFLQQPHYHSFS